MQNICDVPVFLSIIYLSQLIFQLLLNLTVRKVAVVARLFFFFLVLVYFLFFFSIAEALGTGSSSWHSEDGGPNSRRGGETPSSCATPTSASFPSEPEVDADVNPDGTNPAAPYPCQFCDRKFPRLSYLKKHEQVKTQIPRFTRFLQSLIGC